MLVLASLVCGFIFGLGLLISGLVQPTKVLGFLDIFGGWDPSLAVVMAAALIVSAVGFRVAERRQHPLLAPQRLSLTTDDIDGSLVIGSALFGIGWGLVGLCPGPALTNLATLAPGVIAFVAAMAAGMVGHDVWRRQRSAPMPARDKAAVDG